MLRKLGFLDVFCIASGAMISSGLFVLPGLAYRISGPAVVVGYALAALLMIPALLSQAELSTAMPKAGGAYFFIERSMGAFPGTLAGLANWLSLSLKSAFALVGIGAFAPILFGQGAGDPWLIKWVAVGGCVTFAALNCFSVKVAGRAQVVLVIGLLGALGVYVVVGVPHIQQHPNFDNLFGCGFHGVFATAGLVFVSFGGLTKAAAVAEEVRDPGRNLPRAMLLSYVIVSLLYIAAVLVTVGVVGQALGDGPYGDMTPLTTASGRFMGAPGAMLLSIAAILAFVTTGNGGVLAASRSPLAMSRDGLLPRSFSHMSRRFGTPYISVLATSGFMIVMILLLDIGGLVKVASTMMLILFLLVNVAVLIMRGSGLQNYRPQFRSPWFPWLQLIGVGVYGLLIVQLIAMLGLVPLLTAGGFLVMGTVWYWLYVRPHTRRESALVYLVKRIVSADLGRTGLEAELREIAVQRDEIVHDRFDHLVKDCEILDLQGPTSAEKVFRRVADALSERLGTDADALYEKLQQREADSSTVIQPGLAIPHILLEGHHLFDILLVRCRGGIIFHHDKPYVKTAFILVGSSDERNYHLRALMTIAQIVQEKGFLDRWLAADSPEALRDLVLLSGRQRDTPHPR